ncbi:MAG: DUF1669 domain-containing protein [Bacteroidales bacterium]|nr:DUF1669 domain-containing protein [Bacteroidales bacterium]
MEQAYFSGIRNKIIPLLEEATSKVKVAMAWFTSRELFETLLRCLDRNVEVELILLDDVINYMDYAPDFNIFVNKGGELMIAGSDVGFMHHKFCIIDGKIAITGSYNWTYYAETRNVENIFVTDSSEIVNLYLSEFRRLSNLLSITSSCPRLSWDDIEVRDDVDFRELNYEIERICEVQNKPIRRIFETKTEVVRTEIKLTPYSKHSIGIQALDENENVVFYNFISKNTMLPCYSCEQELFFDSKNDLEFPCVFLYGNPENKDEWHLIKKVDLMQIAKGTSDENLPIRFCMYLDDNGSLKVDISCKKSGQKLTISTLKSDFVKYE